MEVKGAWTTSIKGAWTKSIKDKLIKKEPLNGPDYFAMLPKDIWNIIFKFIPDSRMSILLTSHSFYDIATYYSFPPWEDPDMVLVKAGAIDECNALDIACEKGDLIFFEKWATIANGRWNPLRIRLKDKKLYSPALEKACRNKHFHIIEELLKDKRLEPVITDLIIKEIIWYNSRQDIMKVLLTFDNLDKDKILNKLLKEERSLFPIFSMIYKRFYPDMTYDEIKETYDTTYDTSDYDSCIYLDGGNSYDSINRSYDSVDD